MGEIETQILDDDDLDTVDRVLELLICSSDREGKLDYLLRLQNSVLTGKANSRFRLNP